MLPATQETYRSVADMNGAELGIALDIGQHLRSQSSFSETDADSLSAHPDRQDDLSVVKESASSELLKVSTVDAATVDAKDLEPELDKSKNSEASSVSADNDHERSETTEEKEGPIYKDNFRLEHGVIYVSNDHFDSPPSGQEYHVVVGLDVADVQSPKRNDTSGYETNNTSSSLPFQLPTQMRIINPLVTEDLRPFSISTIYSHHLAPFRSLIMAADAIRRHLEQKESEFQKIERRYPNHEAEGKTTMDDKTVRARATLDGIRALVHFLDTDLREPTTILRQLRGGAENNSLPPKLPFSYLFLLFSSGQEVVAPVPRPQAYRVLQAAGGSMAARGELNRGMPVPTVLNLTIECFCLDFDGKEVGPVPHTVYIRPYDGLMDVTQLPVYPMMYGGSTIRRYFDDRGHKFAELAGPSHRKYKGLNLKEGDRFDTFEEIDSDVMVDFQLAFLNSEARIKAPEFGRGALQYPQMSQSAFVRNTPLLRTKTFQTLDNDSYILLPFRVYGYVLLNRKWFPLDIDLIEKVPTVKPGENDGFQKLVLPEGHKDIVRALVNTHARQVIGGGKISKSSANHELDIVKGKGRGLIILLHGAPGVGKTSTAECVAANAGRPLLPITCGDLGGTSAREVEENLETFFDLARKWGCVLLLDEADVFLSAREKGDIRQISLVSVFLRVLEYYSGILILTTNRVGSFDEAIKSRVHCTLYYPPLDDSQSFQIWKMNINLLDERNKGSDHALRVRFSRQDIETYAQKHWKRSPEDARWNGRQIKNAFQTAIALAEWDHYQQTGGNPHPDGPLLLTSHFDIVAKASAHFDEYLAKVRGTDKTRAKANEIRRDDIRLEEEREVTKKKAKAASFKSKAKAKARPPSREPEEESEEEEDSEDEEEGEEASENESDEAEEPPPSPPPKKKKSSGKKTRKE
ncbi:P-loop containing nucleoside triphosphate hydrolase protein [Bombardia bombarda]|uniref:P-loop containing nucleoside triphosphate hydrolase protein n=1 Tax=Bombardia bombarda TaxID=252184 RepID=A0AA40C1W7_9PEZI|nr:P-loop containing nucleoside triphosphate hydrolase protein [Bombardia bombarda]